MGIVNQLIVGGHHPVGYSTILGYTNHNEDTALYFDNMGMLGGVPILS